MSQTTFRAARQAAPAPTLNWQILAAAAVLLIVSATIAATDPHVVNYAIVQGLNRFVGRWYLLDHAAHDLTKESFSNALMTALIWYCWFATRDGQRHARMVAGVLATVAIVLFCYKLQALLPNHLRPLNDPDLVFRVPRSVNPAVFSHGLAFPSEHATLLFGLAMTAWLTDRRIGVLAAAFASCCVLARVYLGFVFPTDVVAGAMLGVLAAGLAQLPWLLDRAEAARRWGMQRPAFFAALSFYLCFEIGRLFEDYRYVAAGVVAAARAHAGH